MSTTRQEERKVEDSPESQIVPYESIDARQEKISGEKLPRLVLGVCDNCLWSCTYMNRKYVDESCPVCDNKISHIPMTIDEVSSFQIDKNLGIILSFDRKMPFR